MTERDVQVPSDGGAVLLDGVLSVPTDPVGVVVFAHGSGSSRHSSRNRFVATMLNESRLATLLFDLLTDDEARDRENVFDIELLASRLGSATRWVAGLHELADLPIGCFGASTGAAAALWAAGAPGSGISAVVSRGGRPDLAERRLGDVTAPTLLIVGGDDHVVLDLNRRAERLLRCEAELVVVPGATHLFEEPGTLATAAGLARDWFVEHFAAGRVGR